MLMHTFEWSENPNQKADEDMRGVFVHHNGDWSGDAHINIPADMVKVEEEGNIDTDITKQYGRVRITLPGKLLKDISREATIHEVIGRLEDMV